jgi:hypothetical protein
LSLPHLPADSGCAGHGVRDVRRDDYRIIRGDPIKRQSSDFGERWFCGDCGTPLAMLVSHQPDTIDFTIATLDDPANVRPGFHIWMQAGSAGSTSKTPCPATTDSATTRSASRLKHGFDSRRCNQGFSMT